MGYLKVGGSWPRRTFSHLKMDGWNTISFPFGMAYFQGGACIFTKIVAFIVELYI